MVADGSDRLIPYAVAVALGALACAYVIASRIADAPLIILLLNGLSLSTAVGLCVYYAPVAIVAFVRPRPTQADWFAAGLLVFGFGLVGERAISILVRDFAMVWLVDSAIKSAQIAMTAFGMLCFVIAPSVGVTPILARRRDLAFWVAAGIGLAFAILVVHHGRAPPVRLSVGMAQGGR